MQIDGRAGIGGRLDVDSPAGQRRTLFHAFDAELRSCAGRVRRALEVEAAAVVLDDREYLPVAALDDQAHARGLGVLEDVGQRLLHDAVDSRLDGRRKALVVKPDRVYVHCYATLRRPLPDEQAQRGVQPQVVQRWRAQLECEVVNRLVDPQGQLPQLLDTARHVGRAALLLLRGLEADVQRGEVLPERVVQLARDAASLLLLRTDELLK